MLLNNGCKENNSLYSRLRPEKETMQFYEEFERIVRKPEGGCGSGVFDESLLRASSPALFTEATHLRSNIEWLDIMLKLLSRKWSQINDSDNNTTGVYLLKLLVVWQLRYVHCENNLERIQAFATSRQVKSPLGELTLKRTTASTLLTAVESGSLDTVRFVVERLGALVCTSTYSVLARAVCHDHTGHIVEYLMDRRKIELETCLISQAEYKTSVALDEHALRCALEADLSDKSLLLLLESASLDERGWFLFAARYERREPEERVRSASLELALLRLLHEQPQHGGVNLLATDRLGLLSHRRQQQLPRPRLFELLCYGAPPTCVTYLCAQLKTLVQANCQRRNNTSGSSLLPPLADVYYQSVLVDAITHMLELFPVSAQRYVTLRALLSHVSDETQLKWLVHGKLSTRGSFDYHFTLLVDHNDDNELLLTRKLQRDTGKCLNDTFELQRVLFECNLVDVAHCLRFMSSYVDGWLDAFNARALAAATNSTADDSDYEESNSWLLPHGQQQSCVRRRQRRRRVFIQFNQLVYMLFDMFEFLLERDCFDMSLVKGWWNTFALKVASDYFSQHYLSSSSSHVSLYLHKINSYIAAKCLLFELKYARTPRTLKFLARSSVKRSLRSSSSSSLVSLNNECLAKLHLPKSLELYLNNNNNNSRQ